MSEKKLIRNAIKCVHCGDVIESRYTHDFKCCSCGTVSVDGGLSYRRRGFKNSSEDFIDLSEWKEVDVIKSADYTILSIPHSIEFNCPYCDEDIELPFVEDYWESGNMVDCPNCNREIELGDWEYD